jgi:putative tricarboxylic transport membrane protein
MRRAELVMAAALGLFSLYLMYMSQIPPLQIGWVPERGPGSGAFPFWLSLGMLISCIAIFVRGWQRVTPHSHTDEPYLDPHTHKLFATASGAIFAMLLLTYIIGAYFAIMLFLFFFIRYIGGHGWPSSIGVSVLFPVGIFFLFESGMKIILPKGYAEPMFIPLYRWFVY